MVQFLPKFMNYAAIILGTLSMIALCVLIALYHTEYTASKWICFAVLLILVLITVFEVFFNSKAWAIHGILLD